MKTAQQWKDQIIGEISLEKIKEIQSDALTHAAQLVTAHSPYRDKGFREILKAIQSLEPQAAEALEKDK